MDYKLLLCVLVAAIVSCIQALSVTSCLNPTSPQLVTVHASVSPDPVVLPGAITLSLTANVLRNITGSLNLDVRVAKNMFMGTRIPLPCIQTRWARLGSCTYRDLCRVLPRDNTRCPRAMKNNNIPCSCPIHAGIYNLPPTRLPFGLKNANVFSSMIAGDYEARITLTDVTSNTELVCYDVKLTVSDPPSSSILGGIGSFFKGIFGG